jgi:hypothetical protein
MVLTPQGFDVPLSFALNQSNGSRPLIGPSGALHRVVPGIRWSRFRSPGHFVLPVGLLFYQVRPRRSESLGPSDDDESEREPDYPPRKHAVGFGRVPECIDKFLSRADVGGNPEIVAIGTTPSAATSAASGLQNLFR